MKKLYISDLDGTLLNNNGELSEYAKTEIENFYREGVLFSVATARSCASIRLVLGDLKFNAPVVLNNGVMIYDLNENRAVSYHSLTKEAVESVFSLFSEYSKHPMLFLYSMQEQNMYIRYTEFDNAQMEEFYNIRKKTLEGRFTREENITKTPEDKDAIYMNYWAPKEELDPIVERLKMIPDITFSYYRDSYCGDWLLEIYSAKASKANGVREVKESVNADFVTAFGDNLNDISMLEAADIGVAVSNAAQGLFEHADLVIGTNEKNSVIDYVKADVKE